MSETPHRLAFYADTYYNPALLEEFKLPPLAYWIPPAYLDVEAILLGGDINYAPEQLGKMLRDIRATQHPETVIVAVPGNGDYLDHELESARAQYRDIVASIPNTVFLDDELLVLPSGVRIIGSTLWSMVRPDKLEDHDRLWREHGLRGVDNIRIGERFMTARDGNAFYAKARAFIEGELRASSPAERARTVVCTHFWPTWLPWRDADGNYDDPWFQVTDDDFDPVFHDVGPARWLCGHIHQSKDVTIGPTRVSSNPRMGEGPDAVNPDFNERYIVEIPRSEAR